MPPNSCTCPTCPDLRQGQPLQLCLARHQRQIACLWSYFPTELRFFPLSVAVFRIVPRAFIVPVFHFEPLPAFAAGQFLPSSRQSSSGLAWDLGGMWTAPARAAGAPGSPCLSEVCRASSFHKAGRPLPSTECGAADTEGAVCRPRLLRRSPPGGGDGPEGGT